jgi:O-antigen/teichoic acid export membrane protein
VTEGNNVGEGAGTAKPSSGGAGRIQTGVSRLFGFGLSVLALGVLSLVAIPAMIAADGKDAWGAIALGQAIGTSGGVIAAYGWGLFGPAEVATATATQRRAGYLESLLVRLTLLGPVSLVAASLAFVLAPSMPIFAAIGAVSATSIGLSTSWYFVGLARPYAMLLLETLPRASGLAVGIGFMNLGYSAVMLPVCALVGMIAGFAISASWVLRSTRREGAEHSGSRPLRQVLSSRRHGVATDFAMTTFASAPLMIVSIIAPVIQPTFALADRLGRQADVALAPARTVLQGWVPRATGSARAKRARIALMASAGFAIVVGAGLAIAGPALMRWLGNGQISVSWGVVLLVAACVALNFFVRAFELVVLAPFGRLDIAAKAIIASAVVGLPTVALGAVFFGTIGSLSGVLVGLIVCGAFEYAQYARSVRQPGSDAATSALGRESCAQHE